jgi:hypothetical protein
MFEAAVININYEILNFCIFIYFFDYQSNISLITEF